MNKLTQLDKAVLSTCQQRGQSATYVIRNRLYDFGKGPNLKTSQVLARLKKMERLGLVERVPTSYAVMIAWATSHAGLSALKENTDGK